VAGEVRTCTNCGNKQTAGDFCERCGTRLPVAEAKPPVAEALTAPVVAAQVVAGAGQQAAYQQPTPPPYQDATQPQYVAPRQPGPFSKLFDLSFQGFVTRDSLRVLFTTTLVLLGAYWLFALIFGIVAAAKLQGYWCLGIFSSLALVSLMIIWTRIMMELTMTVSKMREDIQQAAEAKAASTTAPKAKK
jgi:hypothetical protein